MQLSHWLFELHLAKIWNENCLSRNLSFHDLVYRESLLLADFGGKEKPWEAKSASNEELFSTKTPKRGKKFFKVHFFGISSDLGLCKIHQIRGFCNAYVFLVTMGHSLNMNSKKKRTNGSCRQEKIKVRFRSISLNKAHALDELIFKM